MSRPYYAAACQTAFECPQSRDQIGHRVARMCAMAENTILGYEPFFDVRLLAFPEFAHAAPIYDSVTKLRERLAVRLPNEHTDRYASLCRKYGCFIQTGSFLEMDDEFPDAVFNTTLLIGPEGGDGGDGGVLSKYRKVNPWIPWEVHASPHDFVSRRGATSTPSFGQRRSSDVQRSAEGEGRGEGALVLSSSTLSAPLRETNPAPPHQIFPVAQTEIGNLGVAICYDWLFPETIRQIAFNGAEVIVRVSAYMDPWGATQPMDWWTLFNRARAAENTAYVVAANQGASLAAYPPFSWPGGSMVVDYDGRILAQADPGEGEKVVVAGPIDIDLLRKERTRRVGHDMRSHLRSSVHTYTSREYLPPASTHPITMDDLRARIGFAKERTAEAQRHRDVRRMK